MSATGFLALLGIIWLVTGLVIAFVMRRRGHDFWVWLTLGAVLGLFAVPLAVERARCHPIEYQAPGPKVADGPFDILVGLDGSPQSVAALRRALALFGRCVSSVTLANVLDLDSGGEYTGSEARDRSNELLTAVAATLEFEPVTTRILFGRPDQVLVEHAAENGMELIVVGAKGHGASETLFGSVTARLVGESPIPVFVGPGAVGSTGVEEDGGTHRPTT